MDSFYNLFDDSFSGISDTVSYLSYLWSCLPDTMKNLCYVSLVLGVIVGLFLIAFELL